MLRVVMVTVLTLAAFVLFVGAVALTIRLLVADQEWLACTSTVSVFGLGTALLYLSFYRLETEYAKYGSRRYLYR